MWCLPPTLTCRPSSLQLELGDNRLTGGLEHLKGCPALQHLSLVGNRIALPDDLRPLVSLAATWFELDPLSVEGEKGLSLKLRFCGK